MTKIYSDYVVYVEPNSALLHGMWRKRLKGYRDMGYAIVEGKELF